MNLLDLKQLVEQYTRNKEDYKLEQIRVCIPIKTVSAIGGTPVVDIKSMQSGFDWDNGKLMIYPIEDLSITDHDYLAKMRKEADDLGWSVYEFNNIKRENKKLLKKITELEQMLDLLGGNK